MFAEEMKGRTKQFAIRVVRFYQNLPKTGEAQVMGKQLLRSATSVGANYRAVCRARSDKEFFAKLSITIEEIDESMFWLELFIETKIMKKTLLKDLMIEGEELLKILAKSRKTMKAKQSKAPKTQNSQFKTQN